MSVILAPGKWRQENSWASRLALQNHAWAPCLVCKQIKKKKKLSQKTRMIQEESQCQCLPSVHTCNAHTWTHTSIYNPPIHTKAKQRPNEEMTADFPVSSAVTPILCSGMSSESGGGGCGERILRGWHCCTVHRLQDALMMLCFPHGHVESKTMASKCGTWTWTSMCAGFLRLVTLCKSAEVMDSGMRKLTNFTAVFG